MGQVETTEIYVSIIILHDGDKLIIDKPISTLCYTKGGMAIFDSLIRSRYVDINRHELNQNFSTNLTIIPLSSINIISSAKFKIVEPKQLYNMTSYKQ